MHPLFMQVLAAGKSDPYRELEIAAVAGLIAGATACWFWLNSRIRAAVEREAADLLKRATNEIDSLKGKNKQARMEIMELKRENGELLARLDKLANAR